MHPGRITLNTVVLGVPEVREPRYPSALGEDDPVMVGPVNGLDDRYNDWAIRWESASVDQARAANPS